MMPEKTEVAIVFGEETAEIQISGIPVERLKFLEKEGQVTFTKIQGGSPCDPATDKGGIYKTEFKKDTFTLIPIKDECAARVNGFKESVFI